MSTDSQKIGQIVDAAIDRNTKILGIESDIVTLKSDVSTLKSDVSTLKSDVETLKSDVSTLKSDVSTLKSDVGTLKSDVGTLKSDVHHQGLLYEAMQRDINLILDAVIPLRKNSEEFANLVAAHIRHDDRLSAVESGFKQHTQDKHAHS